MEFHENDLISTYLSELTIIEDIVGKQKIQLYLHKQLGKVLIINDEIQHIESYQAIYHELLIHLPIAFIPTVKNVLILGGGSLFAANEVLKYPTIESVILCDYDHQVLDLMGRYYSHAGRVLNNPKFHYVEQDAFDYLIKSNIKYDLIVNDCFNIIKESHDRALRLYDILTNMCSNNGICVDIIYRHIFDKCIINESLKELKAQKNLALSMVFVPEYPGVLHLETIWGKNENIDQNLKQPINYIQLQKQSNELFEFYNPKCFPFYMYLPPYLKKAFNL